MTDVHPKPRGISVGWRWDGETLQWLPVCEAHLEPEDA